MRSNNLYLLNHFHIHHKSSQIWDQILIVRISVNIKYVRFGMNNYKYWPKASIEIQADFLEHVLKYIINFK